jgi:hypothetical protein
MHAGSGEEVRDLLVPHARQQDPQTKHERLHKLRISIHRYRRTHQRLRPTLVAPLQPRGHGSRRDHEVSGSGSVAPTASALQRERRQPLGGRKMRPAPRRKPLGQLHAAERTIRAPLTDAEKAQVSSGDGANQGTVCVLRPASGKRNGTHQLNERQPRSGRPARPAHCGGIHRDRSTAT